MVARLDGLREDLTHLPRPILVGLVEDLTHTPRLLLGEREEEEEDPTHQVVLIGGLPGRDEDLRDPQVDPLTRPVREDLDVPTLRGTLMNSGIPSYSSLAPCSIWLPIKASITMEVR
jgi:hypothetical protein